MEFVQFYPSMMFSPLKVTISSPLFGDGAILRNVADERFMEKYDPAGNMATRDIMSRAIFNEVMEGRGHQGCVFMDCREIPEAALTSKYAELLRLLAKANLNPLKDLIPISPAVHFSMGGVAINNDTETSVPGLLACGEAVGGLHGANRLAGNALPETFVFGMVAGQHAADLLKTRTQPELTPFGIEPFRQGKLPITELRKNLRKTTWNYLSIIKTHESGRKALAKIDSISAAIEDASVETVYDLVSFYELKSMVTTARLIVAGSLARKESRGSHFRSDYPKTDDENFKGSFFYGKKDDRLKMTFHPVDG
jgi:succinate dehydrogenase/fumarate reductase flavoprotein subunit